MLPFPASTGLGIPAAQVIELYFYFCTTFANASHPIMITCGNPFKNGQSPILTPYLHSSIVPEIPLDH
jgi:hypothetical protein